MADTQIRRVTFCLLSISECSWLVSLLFSETGSLVNVKAREGVGPRHSLCQRLDGL